MASLPVVVGCPDDGVKLWIVVGHPDDGFVILLGILYLRTFYVAAKPYP